MRDTGTSMQAEWCEYGVCANDPEPDLWFPVGEGLMFADQIDAAKALCRRCPVRLACLAHALAHHEHGVWGAMTESERVAARRRLGRCDDDELDEYDAA